MKLIRGGINLRDQQQPCVATIGNFDGVHLGHQRIIKRLIEKGKSLGLPASVITFEPQPLEFFSSAEAPPRLTRLREKYCELAKLELDRVIILPFNQPFAQLSPEAFVHELLVDKLHVKHLVVGDDFRFGKKRAGTFAYLQQAAKQYQFEVANTETVFHDDERISSSRIRQLLKDNQLDAASQLLGRPYTICGRVAHGDKRGRTINFPTANVHLNRIRSPLNGVYAVQFETEDGNIYPGVANLGRRPTVSGSLDTRLEVHLLDFSGDLYGQQSTTTFLKHIRDERKFDSFDALKNQIQLDTVEASAFFNR